MRRAAFGDIMAFGVGQNFLAAAAECVGACARADAAFAARQIRQLPFVFRAGAGILALIFQFEVFARTGKRFALLPAAARRKRWAAWQQSRMRAKRDFAALCAGLLLFSRFSRGADENE